MLLLLWWGEVIDLYPRVMSSSCFAQIGVKKSPVSDYVNNSYRTKFIQIRNILLQSSLKHPEIADLEWKLILPVQVRLFFIASPL